MLPKLVRSIEKNGINFLNILQNACSRAAKKESRQIFQPIMQAVISKRLQISKEPPPPKKKYCLRLKITTAQNKLTVSGGSVTYDTIQDEKPTAAQATNGQHTNYKYTHCMVPISSRLY